VFDPDHLGSGFGMEFDGLVGCDGPGGPSGGGGSSGGGDWSWGWSGDWEGEPWEEPEPGVHRRSRVLRVVALFTVVMIAIGSAGAWIGLLVHPGS